MLFRTVSFIPLNMHASMTDMLYSWKRQLKGESCTMFLMCVYSTLFNKSVIKDTISDSLTSEDYWKSAAGEYQVFIFTLLHYVI